MLTKKDVMKIAQQYAEKVRTELDIEAKIYLFGSMASDDFNEDSDIDIAIISKKFTDDVVGDYAIVASLAHDISWDIEPHAIPYEDTINTTPFTDAIQREGILIWA